VIDVTKCGSTPIGPMIDATSAWNGSSALRTAHPVVGDGVLVE
jgi:hypothetical protein